jgi:hypothetical protein
MANFCPKCGEKINPEDMFCQNCGAKLAKSLETPSTPAQIPPVSVKSSQPPAGIQIIKAIIQIVILGLVLYWVWYSYGCAVGKYLGNGDQMCEQIYQFFQSDGGNGTGNGGNGGSQVNIGCQHCSPGYCWTGTTCCPQSAQYYCNGYCYRTSNEAYNAGCHQSNWTRWCCP